MVNPEWFSIREAQEKTGVSDSYLTRLLRSGRLTGKQIGNTWLVDPESLNQWETKRNEKQSHRQN